MAVVGGGLKGAGGREEDDVGCRVSIAGRWMATTEYWEHAGDSLNEESRKGAKPPRTEFLTTDFTESTDGEVGGSFRVGWVDREVLGGATRITRRVMSTVL